jgi:hypothetical protein
LCPTPPATTAGSCAARNRSYCDGAACVPANSWLRCVCPVSAEICDAIDALSFRGVRGVGLRVCILTTAGPLAGIASTMAVAKAAWFSRTNSCIFGHWRAAFDALNDPRVAIPSGITPEWSAAVTICRSSGLRSKACCDAHVVAEQHAIDRCGPYDASLFGRLPTDIPLAVACSLAVYGLFVVGGPPFTGDFSRVGDRIAYGKRRCCP